MSRKIDALIAEHVMGWFPDMPLAYDSYIADNGDRRAIRISSSVSYDLSIYKNCPHYSTDIAAAWLVVEKLTDRNSWFCISEKYNDRWEATFNYLTPPVVADTARMAICLAALKAKGIEVEDD